MTLKDLANKPRGRREFLKMTGMLGAAAAFSATVAACSSPGASAGGGSAAASGATTHLEAGISYALSTGFDPMTSSGATPFAANMHIFEGLVDLHPATREPYLALAAADPKQLDDTSWEVKLRSGAKFHNGDPVTVDDVVYSFERVLDAKNASLFAQFVPFIKTVKAKGDDTVVFTLNYAFPLFPTRISVVKIVPKKLASADQAAFDAAPVGSGPYKLISATKDDKIVFEKFDDYNGAYAAKAEAMTWYLLSDAAARVTAAESGRVSVIEDVPYLDVDRLKAKMNVESVQSFGLLFLMFNCAEGRSPTSACARRSTTPWTPRRSSTARCWATPRPRPPTCRKPTRSTSRPPPFTATTRPAPRHCSRKPASTTLEFELLTTDTSWVKDIAPLMLESWNKLPGVKVTMQNLQSGALYTDHVDTGTFRVVAAPGDPSVFGNDLDLLLSWFYRGDVWPTKRFRWSKAAEYKALQGMLDAAVKAKDEAGATKAWTEAINLISENVPLYPVLHRQLPTAWERKVG